MCFFVTSGWCAHCAGEAKLLYADYANDSKIALFGGLMMDTQGQFATPAYVSEYSAMMDGFDFHADTKKHFYSTLFNESDGVARILVVKLDTMEITYKSIGDNKPDIVQAINAALGG